MLPATFCKIMKMRVAISESYSAHHLSIRYEATPAVSPAVQVRTWQRCRLPHLQGCSDAGLRGAVPAGGSRQAKDREEILHVLKQTQGRVAGPQGAAARMGIKRTTLISRMKKLGIDPRRIFEV